MVKLIKSGWTRFVNNSIEYILSNLLTEDLVDYVESHPDCIEELIQFALSDAAPLCSRAAWLLSKITRDNDPRIKPYTTKFLEIIPQVKDGHQRDLINVLRKMNLNEEEEGLFFDLCVTIWCDLSKIPSARYYAFQYLLKIVDKYPDLINEIVLLTEDFYLESLSPGIKRTINKMIKNLHKNG